MMITETKNVLGKEIKMLGTFIGSDVTVVFSGGDDPHIGGVVLAMPYKSHGKPSAAFSSISVPCHKDEIACRQLARLFSLRFNRITVVSGGVHYDDLTAEGIQMVEDALSVMAERLMDRMTKEE